jgi:hypothetical protein
MKSLTDTSFFNLLNENEDNPSELRREYDEFALLVFSESKTANDRTDYHSILVYTYVELTCLVVLSKKNASVYVEKAIELVDKQIALVEKQLLAEQTGVHCPFNFKTAIQKMLPWKGETVELVELLYALHEAGSFGKIFLNNLFVVAGKVFGVEISNYYRLFWGSKTRMKGDRTIFLDKLKQALNAKIEKSDEKASRK